MSIDYHPQPNAAHNTAWWPEVKDTYEAFVREHPRQPLPDTLTWEMGNSAAFNRAHWLIIDRLGAQKSDAKALADLNDMPMPPSADFGARSIGMRINQVADGIECGADRAEGGRRAAAAERSQRRGGLRRRRRARRTSRRDRRSRCSSRATTLPVELEGIYQPQIVETPPKPLFARGGAPGRVDLARAGNVVTATTRGVAAFTLLLSPDQFDFGKPVKVVANGKTVFDGKVEKNVRTLLKYAASDNDRTMLFGAELHIKLD